MVFPQSKIVSLLFRDHNENRQFSRNPMMKLPFFVPDAAAVAHTRLTSTKMFTNLKVNLKGLVLYIGAKKQLVSYEFEYFYQCIMTFWGPRDPY